MTAAANESIRGAPGILRRAADHFSRGKHFGTKGSQHPPAGLEQHQGEQFYTAKCLPFCYIICGGELFVDRRSKSITISTVAAALQKIATRQAPGEAITGPKKIGCYGAGYLYPMF